MSMEQNLGRTERRIRLLLGTLLAAWVVMLPAHTGLHWVALLAAIFLVLNGVSGRCYLWRVLNLDSRERCNRACGRGAVDH